MAHIAQQERSKRSLEQLLSATEQLLAGDRLLEQLTVVEITARAGLSVGAFYSRFESKADLLPALQERYAQSVIKHAPMYFDPARWEGRDLWARTQLFVRLALRLYLRHRGLIRALAIDWRRWGEAPSPATVTSRAAFHAQLCSVFLPVRHEITHQDPERALLCALLFLGATCRDVLLFSPATHPHPVRLSDVELAEELSRSFYAFLVVPVPPTK